jgi:hypothetical protein
MKEYKGVTFNCDEAKVPKNIFNLFTGFRHFEEYKKQYRELNKVKFAEYNVANRGRMNEKCQCSCGGKYTFCQKARHFRSNKHIKGTEEQIIKVAC